MSNLNDMLETYGLKPEDIGHIGMVSSQELFSDAPVPAPRSHILENHSMETECNLVSEADGTKPGDAAPPQEDSQAKEVNDKTTTLTRAARKRVQKIMNEEQVSHDEAVQRIKSFNESKAEKRNRSMDSNSSEQLSKKQNIGKKHLSPKGTVQKRLGFGGPSSENSNNASKQHSIVLGHLGHPETALSTEELKEIMSIMIKLFDDIKDGDFIPQFRYTKKLMGCLQFVGNDANSIQWIQYQLPRICDLVRKDLKVIPMDQLLKKIDCKMIISGAKMSETQLFKRIQGQNPKLNSLIWKLHGTIQISVEKFMYLISIDEGSASIIRQQGNSLFLNLGMITVKFKEDEEEEKKIATKSGK